MKYIKGGSKMVKKIAICIAFICLSAVSWAADITIEPPLDFENTDLQTALGTIFTKVKQNYLIGWS